MKGLGKRKSNDDKKITPAKKNLDDKNVSNVEDGNVIDGLVFDDPFEDEFELEEYDEVVNDDENDEYEDIDEENEQLAMEIEKNNCKSNIKKPTKTATDKKSKSSSSSVQSPAQSIPKNVWRPGIDKLEEDEELEYDPSAYVMYHSIQTEWPCLSFDFIRDDFGNHRQRVSTSFNALINNFALVFCSIRTVAWSQSKIYILSCFLILNVVPTVDAVGDRLTGGSPRPK
jgi:ribosome assembly protein RRB1